MDEVDEQETAAFVAAGCESVLSVDLPDEMLLEALRAAMLRRQAIAQLALSKRIDTPEVVISDFVAQSSAMKEMVKTLPRIARSNSSVLILGETGVGKERLARVLHMESPRRNGPFVPIHCGALPEALLESELFGHEQGAFTGATRARRGCFELAHNGTVFLDEIGEMPLHLQSKLLRVLESREIRRVGGEKTLTVDVRILAATNRELEEEVADKKFRRDLFYRLNVISLTLPPLTQRRDDIPELVHSYLLDQGNILGDVNGISREALEALLEYNWPGNVRELYNVLERAILLCEADTLSVNDLPVTITGQIPPSITATETPADIDFDALLSSPLKEAKQSLTDSFERTYLTHWLREKKGHLGAVAKVTGIDSRTLFNKMQIYKLDKQDYKCAIEE
jgi:transcriptional regulator with PAS, ATPase and Fis domain